MFEFKQALTRIIDRHSLSFDEMRHVMEDIMNNRLSPVQMAAFVTGMRVKGETIEEIAAAASVMRSLSKKVAVQDRSRLVDIVGTGGDGSSSFNVSTTAMFVMAAAGGRVAKHGNRSVSSKSGSADVLEALGAFIELEAEQVAECVAQTGIGFMFAPMHHPAMKHVAPVRKELGVRTLFNVLGPLTNPADAPNMLMGVFKASLVPQVAGVLVELGIERGLVVYGRDGLDELSIGKPTLVAEVINGDIEEYEIEPEDFGIKAVDLSVLAVDGPEESRAMMLRALSKEASPAKDIVVLNAGAGLFCAGVARSIVQGVDLARETIDSGAALAKVEDFVRTTQALAKQGGQA